jgi:adenylate cyclase
MSVAQRLGRLLERVTRQSGRIPETPDFGSWLLGRATESQTRRRVRIQIFLTVVVVTCSG